MIIKETVKISDLLKNNEDECYFGIEATFPDDASYHNFSEDKATPPALGKYMSVELDEAKDTLTFTIVGLKNVSDDYDENGIYKEYSYGEDSEEETVAEDETSDYDGRLTGGLITFLPVATFEENWVEQYGDGKWESIQSALHEAEYLFDQIVTYKGEEYRVFLPMHED